MHAPTQASDAFNCSHLSFSLPLLPHFPGLAAARQLRMLGYRVAVVEGRDRPGGRVHTLRMEVGPPDARPSVAFFVLRAPDARLLVVRA